MTLKIAEFDPQNQEFRAKSEIWHSVFQTAFHQSQATDIEGSIAKADEAAKAYAKRFPMPKAIPAEAEPGYPAPDAAGTH